MSNTAYNEDNKDTPPAQTSEDGALQTSFKAVADNRVRIGFLLGNDVSATIAANASIKLAVNAGYQPVIYMAKHRPSKKPEAKQLELQEFTFYERYLLNNVVKPFVNETGAITKEDGWPNSKVVYTPEQLAEVYNLEIETIENINSPYFVNKIKNDHLMPVLTSIRCYQIAHEGLIDAQRSKTINTRNGSVSGNIWNLHPGKLPEFQGIYSPLYVMNGLQRTAAYSLHEIIYDPNDPNKGIDKGPIITLSTAPINYNRPAIDIYLSQAEDAGRMIYSRFEDFMSGGVPTTPQAKAEHAHQSKYFTHPKPEFFRDEWPTVHKRLIELADSVGFAIDPRVRMKENTHPETPPKIVNPHEMIEFYVQAFAGPDSKVQKALHKKLKKEVDNWEKNKHVYIAAHANQTYGVVDTMLMSGGSFLQWTKATPKPTSEFSSVSNDNIAPKADNNTGAKVEKEPPGSHDADDPPVP